MYLYINCVHCTLYSGYVLRTRTYYLLPTTQYLVPTYVILLYIGTKYTRYICTSNMLRHFFINAQVSTYYIVHTYLCTYLYNISTTRKAHRTHAIFRFVLFRLQKRSTLTVTIQSETYNRSIIYNKQVHRTYNIIRYTSTYYYIVYYVLCICIFYT